MRLPMQARPSGSRAGGRAVAFVPGARPGVQPDGIFDDILGGVRKVIGTVGPVMGAVAPVACSMCALIPDPMAQMACRTICSAVT
jgi:hypothetical protein